MAEQTRIRFNPDTGEFEIEGSEKFVQEQVRKLPEIMESLKKGKSLAKETTKKAEAPAKKTTTKASQKPAAKTKAPKKAPKEAKAKPAASRGRAKAEISAEVAEKFQNWYNEFPKKLTQNDKLLIAGFFIQSTEHNRPFYTAEANALLRNQGIKITNAANSLQQLEKLGRVELTKKEGRWSYFKVNDTGKEYLSKLMKKK